MARRFSRVRNGQVYADALTQYRNWLAESTTRRNNGVGTGTARPPMLIKYLTPFGTTVPTDTKAEAKVSQPAFQRVTASLDGRLDDTTTNKIRIIGYKPAKVIVFDGSGSGVAATSEITGMRYLKYNGTSRSCPFGRKTATELEYDAFTAIRSAVMASGSNVRVSYQAEQFKAR